MNQPRSRKRLITRSSLNIYEPLINKQLFLSLSSLLSTFLCLSQFSCFDYYLHWPLCYAKWFVDKYSWYFSHDEKWRQTPRITRSVDRLIWCSCKEITTGVDFQAGCRYRIFIWMVEEFCSKLNVFIFFFSTIIINLFICCFRIDIRNHLVFYFCFENSYRRKNTQGIYVTAVVRWLKCRCQMRIDKITGHFRILSRLSRYIQRSTWPDVTEILNTRTNDKFINVQNSSKI